MSKQDERPGVCDDGGSDIINNLIRAVGEWFVYSGAAAWVFDRLDRQPIRHCLAPRCIHGCAGTRRRKAIYAAFCGLIVISQGK